MGNEDLRTQPSLVLRRSVLRVTFGFLSSDSFDPLRCASWLFLLRRAPDYRSRDSGVGRSPLSDSMMAKCESSQRDGFSAPSLLLFLSSPWILSTHHRSTQAYSTLYTDSRMSKSSSSMHPIPLVRPSLPSLRSLDISRYLSAPPFSSPPFPIFPARRVVSGGGTSTIVEKHREEEEEEVIVLKPKLSSRVGMKLATQVCVPW